MDTSELDGCLKKQNLSYEKRNDETFLVASKKFGKRYPVQALLSIRDGKVCVKLQVSGEIHNNLKNILESKLNEVQQQGSGEIMDCGSMTSAANQFDLHLTKLNQKLFDCLVDQYKATTQSSQHCKITTNDNFYTSRAGIRQLVDNFLQSSSEGNFRVFWNRGLINAAQQRANATNILTKSYPGDIDALAAAIRELVNLKNPIIDDIWGKIDGARNAASELYYYYHMQDDHFPLVNGGVIGAMNSLKKAGITIEGENIVRQLQNLKHHIFPQNGGGGISGNQQPPKFFKLDQLLNLLDKIKLDDIDKVEDKDSRGLYQLAYLLTFWQGNAMNTGFEEEFDTLIERSNNIIFYGAPGTGKTYTAEQNINRLISENTLPDVSDEDRFLKVQFHPSYSYEDFMEGLKPVVTNGFVSLQLMQGRFAQFCEIARKSEDDFNNAKPKEKKKHTFFFLADEINRAELSRVLGELLYCLEYRSKEIETQYSYLKDESNKKFSIPANLYFIGTMNDVDKSIDSFDLALRRRFLWHRMDCDYEVIQCSLEGDKLRDIGIHDAKPLTGYMKCCQNLNQHITEDNGLGLGKLYQIGHSYFMRISDYVKTKSEIKDKHKEDLFDDRLGPLIREYLRSEVDEKQLDAKLKEAKKIFVDKNQQNGNPE